MILARRKAHLVYFIVLAILLPILFIAGVILRPVYGPGNTDLDVLFSQGGEGVSLYRPELIAGGEVVRRFAW